LIHAQIFFPRSIEGEIAARDAARSRRLDASRQKTLSVLETTLTQSVNGGGVYLLTSSPVKQNFHDQGFEGSESSPLAPQKAWLDPGMPSPSLTPQRPRSIRPNRKREGGDVEMGGISGQLTERNLSRHNHRLSRFNPMVHNFTSPISTPHSCHVIGITHSITCSFLDLAYYPSDDPDPRFTNRF